MWRTIAVGVVTFALAGGAALPVSGVAAGAKQPTISALKVDAEDGHIKASAIVKTHGLQTTYSVRIWARVVCTRRAAPSCVPPEEREPAEPTSSGTISATSASREVTAAIVGPPPTSGKEEYATVYEVRLSAQNTVGSVTKSKELKGR
jgi:hypothetical protein